MPRAYAAGVHFTRCGRVWNVRAFVVALLIGVVLSAAESAPRLEPLSGAPPYPPDNPPTKEKVELGEMLFFETMLSGGGRRSCGTCHKPELLFMDGLSRAWGLNESELSRKAPGLLNVGWQRTMFFDGRAESLEEQVPMPLEHPQEMALDPETAASRVAADPGYRRLFEKAFPGEPITFDLIAKAVASYERTLVSYDSDLDRYLNGDGDALRPAAKRGMGLFKGKAGCIKCHNGPLLTDHQRHYTGVPERVGDSKPGSKYKTQSLRDVTRRFSYMHNGMFMRMEKVLDHYVRGGSAPPGLEAEISPVPLTSEERSALTAFLHALNGRITGAELSPPRATDVFDIPGGKRSTADADSADDDPSYAK